MAYRKMMGSRLTVFIETSNTIGEFSTGEMGLRGVIFHKRQWLRGNDRRQPACWFDEVSAS